MKEARLFEELAVTGLHHDDTLYGGRGTPELEGCVDWETDVGESAGREYRTVDLDWGRGFVSSRHLTDGAPGPEPIL